MKYVRKTAERSNKQKTVNIAGLTAFLQKVCLKFGPWVALELAW